MKNSLTNLAALALLVATAVPATAQDLRWKLQFGTVDSDLGLSVAADREGNAYIGGWTYLDLAGPSAGFTDAFIAKFDAGGVLRWKRQLGTPMQEYGRGVAVDLEENAYLCGVTYGSLARPLGGDDDAFLAKYDAAGTLLWKRQLGTASYDSAYAVAVDRAGNAYMTGQTGGNLGGPIAGDSDAFLAKYDPAGTLLWTRQLGTSDDEFGQAVCLDSDGNAFITGTTSGSLGGPIAGGSDAFLAKYDPSGTLLWTRQLGTSANEQGRGVAADAAGNAYITGYTYGSLGGSYAGGGDAFLAKYDPSGTLLWTRQLGTSQGESADGVAVDAAGNVSISGSTGGSLGGPGAGGSDVFLAKYDAAGTLLWTRQLGSTTDDYGRGVAINGVGDAFMSGFTFGSLGGPNLGFEDAFLVKFGAPCPADLDNDGNLANGGHSDNAVTIDDLLYFLSGFEAADLAADLDNGSGTGVHDGAVTIDDLLFFLIHFEAGC